MRCTDLLARSALSSLALAVALASAPALAQDTTTTPPPAEESDEEDGDGDQITVTGARVETAVSEIPASISILSGERLDEQLSVSPDLNDALTKALPGLVANNERGFSNGRGPLLRGRPASVLINGVPVNQLLRSSGFDLGLIDPLAIDRIEVNRGATAVFGFGASGGVINMLTRRARSGDTGIFVRGQVAFSPNDVGESLTFKTYASGGFANPNGFDLQIGAGFTTSGALIDPNGNPVDSQAVNIYNLDGNIGYEFANGATIRATGNFFRRNFRKDYDSPGYIFGACVTAACNTIIGGYDPRVAIQTPEQDPKDQYQQNYIASLDFNHPDFLGQILDLTVFAQKNTFDYQDIASNFGAVPTFNFVDNNQNNRRIGLRSNLTANIELSANSALSITYGFDYLRDRIFRDFFSGGTSVAQLRYSPAPGFTTYRFGAEVRPLSPPITLTSYAGLLQAKLEVGRLIIQGGVRHEEFRPRSDGYVVANLFGAGNNLVYLEGPMPAFDGTLFNAGIVYSIAGDSEIYAGLSQGLEITELGRFFRGLGGNGTPANPALVAAQPSITTQYEVGFRARLGNLRATGAAYFADAPLSSQLVSAGPLVPLVPARRPQQIWGVEGTLDLRVNDMLSTGAVFTYQNGEYENAAGTKFPIANDEVTPSRLTTYVDVEPTDALSVRLQGTQVFDRSQFPDTPPAVFGTGLTGNVNGYFLLDLLASLKVGQGEVSLGVENLLNNSYVPAERQAFNDLFDYMRAEGTRITIGYQTKF